VVSVAAIVFGHLAGVECRRALGRGWVIVVRALCSLVLALVALCLVWYWWVNARFDASYLPARELRAALACAAMVLLTVDVIMIPAVLAGALAGDRERGVLQLLLTTAASPREIVIGRLIGKLSQVGMILLAGFPIFALLLALNGVGVLSLAVVVLLLASVAVGGGGLAVLGSVIARRGRDALLGVYLIILIFNLSPLLRNFGLDPEIVRWLEVVNPFVSLARAIWYEDLPMALVSSAFWLLIGLCGTAVASVRLKPSCLGPTEKVKRGRRPRRVPPLDDERPMLWKELYIEQVGTLGRFGRWLGILLTLGVAGTGLTLAAVIIWAVFVRHDEDWYLWASGELGGFLNGSGLWMGWLLQWGIGLRAAVAIASERERGTWDALLVSSLEPGEIVIAKVLGSMNALRFLAGAMVLAWTLGAATGSVKLGDYAEWIVGNLTAGALMAAIGVRTSLATSTAARAMTWTITWWLISSGVVAFAALSVILFGIMVVMSFQMYLWTYFPQVGWAPPVARFAFPMSWDVAWPLATNTITLLISIALVAETRLRFDRLAGRMAGGAVESKVDEWLHGHPRTAVFIPAKGSAAETKAASADEALAVTANTVSGDPEHGLGV
jgi:ABC-type transport system involved in multi-copper enzyme maturation permease subunit